MGRAGSSGAFMACIRIGGGLAERNPELDRGTGAGAAFDTAPPAGELGAFSYEDQAEVAGAVLDVGRVVAHAVIDDPDQVTVLDHKELNRDGTGPGVVAHVRQDFQDVSVYQQGGTVRNPGTQPFVQPVGDPGVSAYLLQVNPQGGAQVAVFQARWPEVENELAQVAGG